MTWDVYAVRAAGVRRLDDLPDGYEPPPIGTPEAVAALVREAAPHVDASDPTWLVLDGPDHYVEVALGKDLQVRDVTFYIRGGDGAVGVVLHVCERLGLTPYDTENGGLLTPSSRRLEPPPLTEDEMRPTGWRRWLPWGRGG